MLDCLEEMALRVTNFFLFFIPKNINFFLALINLCIYNLWRSHPLVVFLFLGERGSPGFPGPEGREGLSGIKGERGLFLFLQSLYLSLAHIKR